MSSRLPVAFLAFALLLAAGCSSAGPSSSGAIDPANFTSTIDNPWLPMVPGTTLTYEGTKDDQPAVDTFEITGETKVIDGVTCVVVRDTLTLGGKLHEKTEDWYVQDRQGNVWYFGEQTSVYDAAGKVTDTTGTWQAGVAGALPGIFMPADPTIGQSFQQEFLTGEAQDHFVILLVGTPVTVPYGSYDKAMITAEWTPLEPDVVSEKAYVKGIGLVSEGDIKGGNEGLQLTAVKNP